MGQIIDMVKCAYCDTHVVAEAELVCERCVDKVAADLACVDLVNGISELEKLELSEVKTRANILSEVQGRITVLLMKMAE